MLTPGLACLARPTGRVDAPRAFADEHGRRPEGRVRGAEGATGHAPGPQGHFGRRGRRGGVDAAGAGQRDNRVGACRRAHGVRLCGAAGRRVRIRGGGGGGERRRRAQAGGCGGRDRLVGRRLARGRFHQAPAAPLRARVLLGDRGAVRPLRPQRGGGPGAARAAGRRAGGRVGLGRPPRRGHCLAHVQAPAPAVPAFFQAVRGPVLVPRPPLVGHVPAAPGHRPRRRHAPGRPQVHAAPGPVHPRGRGPHEGPVGRGVRGERVALPRPGRGRRLRRGGPPQGAVQVPVPRRHGRRRTQPKRRTQQGSHTRPSPHRLLAPCTCPLDAPSVHSRLPIALIPLSLSFGEPGEHRGAGLGHDPHVRLAGGCPFQPLSRPLSRPLSQALI